MLLAPILRLPVELHLDIVDRLDLHEKVKLACTNRYFSSIIPPPSHSECLLAETDLWTKNQKLLTCKGCVRFRRFEDFADEMRKGKWCRGRANAIARLCLRCGLDGAFYAPGTHLTISNRPHVLCSMCGRLTDQMGDQGFCAGCSPGPRRYLGRLTDYEDDWHHTTKWSSDGKHMYEFHDICPEV
ncbi:F-box domain-containing protein [Clathrospora elynae]|uniref:F-box domain-containing protein n=1 Tax=Clathrospora elynae TaxID=706981 RepID=A0A6A5SHE8_9PLEO|nr:F-box domain-containing protein [Clathrospora elynae]